MRRFFCKRGYKKIFSFLFRLQSSVTDLYGMTVSVCPALFRAVLYSSEQC
jgi:hypothetical protein